MFKEVAKFIRKSLGYLAETLDFLTDHIHEPNYQKLSFLIYKIILAIQKDTSKKSSYW